MSAADAIAEGARILTICNACRYCEGYCAVFTSMERRLTFEKGDVNYLANLCHNCGECLYACQYAPPHEFALNVPRTLAEIRRHSYEQYAWPGALARLFRLHGPVASLTTSALFAVIVALLERTSSTDSPLQTADFYAVIPHHTMVGLFGAVAAAALLALGIGVTRFWRDANAGAHTRTSPDAWRTAMNDVFTLRNLHGSDADCTDGGVEARSPWRRRFHHLTFYGFALCFASTTVAAIYHSVFGWLAPYAYTSLPVVLGTIGGVALTIGPLGLYWRRRRRDPMATDPSQIGLDSGFIVLLVAASVTGLLLLVLREREVMPALLAAHLGVILAFFVTLPYGKFVHGIYRSLALLKNAAEENERSVRG